MSWRFDCNPSQYKVNQKTGKPIKYGNPKGYSEICATPVINEGLVYVATGQDPDEVTVGTLAEGGEVVTIGADDPLDEARRTMEEHQVRRLPVIDGHRLVGMVSQGDLAKALSDDETGRLVESISQE